jgi:hypothetical protein
MSYPVRVDASLQPALSRWLWLVKWILAIPHFVVLTLLSVAYAVLSLVAFVAILVTGRYPRPIFDFNVGVLRWHWRVAYYSYAAFGTDRYPPFTLAEVPDYPAHLDIAYPQRLSRGLALVKWWLLAIPHYLVVGLFVGGGTAAAWQFDDVTLRGSGGGGLVGLLALIAVVILAFTGRYPRQIFDFILGMDRWALRVAAYAGLMTDKYPPFRLDMGGADPGSTLTLPRPAGSAQPASTEPTGTEPTGTGPTGTGASPGTPPASTGRGGWTAGPVVAMVAGTVLAVASVGALSTGGALLWGDQTQRDDGYLTTEAYVHESAGYALASDPVELWTNGNGWLTDSVGDIRIRVTPTDPARPVFVGVAPAAAAADYLAGVRHSTVDNLANSDTVVQHAGTGPAVPPDQAGIWTVQRTGSGVQSVFWPAQDGRWTIVVMNADGSAGVAAEADIGATLPALDNVAAGLLTGGALGLAASILLIAIPIRRTSRATQS